MCVCKYDQILERSAFKKNKTKQRQNKNTKKDFIVRVVEA